MIKTLEFYVNQLSAKRAEIHSKTWWTIGHIIYKQTEGREEGFNLWHEFSKRDKNGYSSVVTNKKWESFEKTAYPSSISILKEYVNKDGGTIYNPNHNKFVEDKEVRNFIYSIIVPKLSIRRMRNRLALNNLCSALFHMSKGADRDEMEKVSKRIKDEQLKKIFISSWDYKKFTHCCDVNDIIRWQNSDEMEKPHPRATKIKGYVFNDPLWLEKTHRYLESYDNAGYTPRYFKVSKAAGDNLKKIVALQKQIELAEDSNEFGLAEALLKKKKALIKGI